MRCSLLVLAIVLLHALPAAAATHIVPDIFPTIGAALAASVGGDTVLVRSGTYPERVTLVDGVVLLGESSFDRPTIDAMGAGVAVTAVACNPGTRMKNFEVVNGVSLGLGGGAALFQATVVFENCRFALNLADHGAAIGADESPFTLIDCEFETNWASQSGGAIAILDPPSPNIQRCTFRSNTATVGGAISVRNGSSPGIAGCLFDTNVASQGAAIWFDFLTSGFLTGNTLAFQHAGAADGGALYVNPLSSPTILSTIIAFGTSGGAIFVASGADPLFGCCDLYGNVGGDDLDGAVDLGTNISADPLFCDAENDDFTVQDISPCLPNPPCSLIGAFGEGCTLVASPRVIETTTWGRLKAGYRD